MKKLKIETQTTRKFNHDITDKYFGFIHNNDAYIIFKDIKGNYSPFNTTALETSSGQYSNLEEYLTYLLTVFNVRVFIFDTQAVLFGWISDTNRGSSMHVPIFGKELLVTTITETKLNTELDGNKYYVFSDGENRGIISRSNYTAKCLQEFTNGNHIIVNGCDAISNTLRGLIELLIENKYNVLELDNKQELAKWIAE